MKPIGYIIISILMVGLLALVILANPVVKVEFRGIEKAEESVGSDDVGILAKELSGNNTLETARNFNRYIKSIYNYTRRNDTIKTLEDIKANGGDCYDYANLYKSLALKGGYNAVTFLTGNESEKHLVAVIWDNATIWNFCIMNMKEYKCM